jgi:hypothetical protein
MIPQMHDDKTLGEEQILSPVENKQMATHLEKQSKPTPASSRRWIGVLLSILGIVLPIAGGFLMGWPWWAKEVGQNMVYATMFYVGEALSVCIGASLLRSWVAVLIVPIAWVAGEVMGAVLHTLVEGGWPALQAALESGFIWIAQGWIEFVALPITLCAALGAVVGVFLSKWLRKRRQQ